MTYKGLKWLNNRNWSEITRDERFFCAHLYNKILGHQSGVQGFVRVINEMCQLNLPVDANWELGYEVCFYRDVMFDDAAKYDERLSLKRTFDLCLFSDNEIVIIEAKAYQAFDSKQTEEFVRDRECIKNILNIPVTVVLIPLASSHYKDTFDNSPLKESFGCELLTWGRLADVYENSDPKSILARADIIYSLRPRSSDSTKRFLSGAELLGLYEGRKVDQDGFWVGRNSGLAGLRKDLAGDAWLDRPYEVNTESKKALNRNWFSLEDFAKTVLMAPPA